MCNVLTTLRAHLLAIPPVESTSLDISRKRLSGLGIMLPFADPKESVQWNFAFKAPQDIKVVGSWVMQTGVKLAKGKGRSNCIDLMLEMPPVCLSQHIDQLHFDRIMDLIWYTHLTDDLARKRLPIISILSQKSALRCLPGCITILFIIRRGIRIVIRQPQKWYMQTRPLAQTEGSPAIFNFQTYDSPYPILPELAFPDVKARPQSS